MTTMAERLEEDGVPAGVDPVLFYGPRDENGWGSNFSGHGLWMRDPWSEGGALTWYKTGEHRYQAMKSDDQRGHEYVRTAATAGRSKVRGHEVVLREGWNKPHGDGYGSGCWYVMFELVLCKALAHPDVLKALLATGDRPIYEDSPTDDIWGWRCGRHHRGKNLLGKCWMDVREVLR